MQYTSNDPLDYMQHINSKLLTSLLEGINPVLKPQQYLFERKHRSGHKQGVSNIQSTAQVVHKICIR